MNTKNLRTIQDQFIPSVSSGSEDRNYRYNDDQTGRSFNIRQFGRKNDPDGASYFLEEFVPNGRIMDTKYGREEPIIKEIEARVSPNGFAPELDRLGINIQRLVFVGGGLGVGSIYYKSLRECADAIQNVLTENVRYKNFKPLSDAEKQAIESKEKEESKNYWLLQSRIMERAEKEGFGLFIGCSNMAGPLDEDAKQRILSYLNAPSRNEWNQVRSLFVNGHETLWAAWCAYEKTAPQSGDKGFPNSEELTSAIRFSVFRKKEEIKERLTAIEKETASALRLVETKEDLATSGMQP